MDLLRHNPPAWVAIQRNPKSGSGPRRRLLLDLIQTLRARGLSCRVFKDRQKLERRVNEQAARDGLVCIVAMGGDGTVADVFNRFPGVPVAILPAGTENLLSRYLGIPHSGGAVGDLIASGHLRTLDLCALGTRRFALMASAGFDADVIHRVHESRSGHISRASYFKPILDSLRRYAYPELKVWLDDRQTPLRGRLVVLSNLPAYALRLNVAGAALGDDGLLDVRLFERGSAFQMMRYFYKVATGVHEQLEDVTVARASRVRIESDVPVPLQVDGDPAGWTPAEIRVLPRALQVYAPP